MHTIELYFVHTQSTSLPCAARRIIPLALCVRSNHWVMIEQLRHAGKKNGAVRSIPLGTRLTPGILYKLVVGDTCILIPV